MSDRVNAGTMTIYRRNRRFILSVDKSLKIFSAFMIPLFISMLTVFIAIYQQKIANDNRSKDLVNLEYQRRLDLSANEQRRTEDSIANAKLRLADRQERENQLKKDREMADFQRQMDINFTRSKLEEEKALEEHIRLMEEEEREKYSQLAHSIKQEDILRKFSYTIKMLKMIVYFSKLCSCNVKFDWKFKGFNNISYTLYNSLENTCCNSRT